MHPSPYVYIITCSDYVCILCIYSYNMHTKYLPLYQSQMNQEISRIKQATDHILLYMADETAGLAKMSDDFSALTGPFLSTSN